MEESIVRKKTIFHSILDFINRISPKHKVDTYSGQPSRFTLFLEGIPTDDDMYEKIEVAAALCDEAYRLASQRIVLSNKISEFEEQMYGLESFKNLDTDETVHLKDLLERFTSLTKEKTGLRHQLMSFDSSLERITELEEDAHNALEQIKDAEKYHRILKTDIGYLEGEKADLEYEMNTLISGKDFVYKFTVGIIALFGFATLFLGFLFIFNKVQIFLPTAVLVLLAIVVTTVLYLFRSRVAFELNLNIKKQQKAVRMLNKKNVVFAYYTNFLDYEYRKYKVRNSAMLQSNLKEYSNYIHTASRLDSIRSIMYETEGLIEKFLKEKKMNHSNMSIEQFAQTVDINDKLEYYKELTNRKNSLEKNLTELDEKHERIWSTLEELNREDTSSEKIIDSIILMYFSEVNKLVDSLDKNGELV